MNATDVMIFAGLAILVIATQVGRRSLSLHRLLLPLVGVGFAAQHYLQGIPTVGGDLDFEVALAAAGAAFGLLAGALMRVEHDPLTGRIMTQAGVAYAALWAIVFGSRLVFAWGASNLWTHQIAQFSLQHEITGAAAWTAAFLLMALTMVAARTAVVAGRALLVSSLRPRLTEAEA